jgi:phage/plasmid primase-like uncharacterized protein
MVSLIPYHEGLRVAFSRVENKSYSTDPRTDFAEKLVTDGFKIKGPIVLGKICRIDDPEDKPNRLTGWYWYDEFEVNGNVLGVGVYGTWRQEGRSVWSSRSQNLMSEAEAAQYRARVEYAQEARDSEQRAIHVEKAIEAANQYNQTKQAERHGYFDLKKIKPVNGVRIYGESLLIPILNEDGNIISLQRIYWSESDKRFVKSNKKGGKMKGGFFRIEGDTNKICICEGMATGASINEATDATVYCAMSASNVYETSSIAKKNHPTADIVICADDNSDNAVNTGLENAKKAGDVFSLRVVSPIVKKDFNDQASAKGLQSVAEIIFPQNKKYESVKDKKLSVNEPPEGFLLDVFRYYNATSGQVQHGFAIQTALALGSVILGRRFRTDEDNFSSLFFLNVGKSGTGKEHAKTVSLRIMKAAGIMNLVGGSGYTSEGAVVYVSLMKPRHLSICDELGRNLAAAKMSGGDKNLHGANTKLMEAIGQCGTALSPRNYSTIGMKREQADAIQKPIQNPAITILAMSTPITFYESIDYKAIMDGFVGRFIISVSDVERDIRRRTAKIEVPETIKDWINAVQARAKHNEIPDLPHDEPPIVTLAISTEAFEKYNEAQWYFLKQATAHEDLKINDANNRAGEFVLRVALIVALSRNPSAEIVEKEDVQWAFDYIKSCVDRVFSDLKRTISGSDFEANKKEALSALRKLSPNGLSLKDMNKKQPFAKWNAKQRKEILDALEEAELAYKECTSTLGRTATVYFAKGD